MPTSIGQVAFWRVYEIDSLTAASFGGTNPNNTMTLTGLTQVDPSAVDSNAVIDDVNGNGEFNAADTLTTTFPGDSTTTDLSRLRLDTQFGRISNGFGSGAQYAIFEDPSGQQYVIFSPDFDTSRISGGSVTLTEQGDAPGNMANEEIICFAQGSLISTPSGPRAVESLKVGDTVMTHDGKTVTIRWVSSSRHSQQALATNPKLRPFRIAAHSFAPDMPSSDLLLSRQHRVMIRSVVASRMSGAQEVLVPVHTLDTHDGISCGTGEEGIIYFHLLTDRHAVLVANGLPCESLFVGTHLRRALGAARFNEIMALVSEGRVSVAPARPLLSNAKSRALVGRITKNGKALYEYEEARHSEATDCVEAA